jgi:sugar-phosphatase
MRAAIFDMDGVLIDSEPLWRRVERQVFAALGVELSEADCEQSMGLRTDELVAHWFERFPWSGPPPADVERTLNTEVRRLVERDGTAMPGAIDAVVELHRAGLPIAVASSSPVSIIEAVVSKLGLEPYLSAACSADDEVSGKPDPAVYLTAARRLGVEPAACIAFEDSPRGLQSALAAGMRVIAIPAAQQFDQPVFDRAHLKLASLEEFTLEMVES